MEKVKKTKSKNEKHIIEDMQIWNKKGGCKIIGENVDGQIMFVFSLRITLQY